MHIAIISTTLSDSSKVFDVRLADGGEFMFFHAVTEADAESFATKLSDLINHHTTADCLVV